MPKAHAMCKASLKRNCQQELMACAQHPNIPISASAHITVAFYTYMPAISLFAFFQQV